MMPLTIYSPNIHPIFIRVSDVVYTISSIFQKYANKQKNTNTTFPFLSYCVVKGVNRVNSTGGKLEIGGNRWDNAQTNDKLEVA